MRQLSLAARYRPQRFGDVAGQPLAATALSRAAATDRVAPAYLLSGTRGVGKTTIARIFAKALNCANAPTEEPCNECSQCRHITAGSHVDVNEIDGASNTGVDDVRALRDTIGFVPMEGRYKIFIVDEAHMLSKNAFNALLKTLEEPPKHTVFIFATTEAHRFPATIISRCQHFVFRHLPEQAIYDHLASILHRENVRYDEGAVRLVARRAQGSVRDSLSLLDQALALNPDFLSEAAARDSLGVAGQELQGKLLAALAAQDCGQIIELTQSLLASGLDLGFFTRELAQLWRNLFLLRQTGKLLPGLTADEGNFLKRHAEAFQAAHLHSAWQMTLESQRNIAQSPEPGAALELLLLNIALLPQLLPVGSPAMPPGPGLAEQPKADYQISAPAPEKIASPATAPENENPDLSWEGFCAFCQAERDAGREAPGRDILGQAQCCWAGEKISLGGRKGALWERLLKARPLLEKCLASYCGNRKMQLEFVEEPAPRPASAHEIENRPELRLCQDILGAQITECTLKPGAGNAKHE
ncbi:MAG: DNA polymerase III subunit gamma/tau [Desulfovibrio sp.]|nr:DNA polymerase III subunit gamma/tau [Desulfovibrio sp.]